MDQPILDQLLFAALQQKDVAQLQHWLEQGANPNATLYWQQGFGYAVVSPLFLLLNVMFCQEIYEVEDYKRFITLLLNAGATLCCHNNDKMNVLAFIASKLNMFFCRNKQYKSEEYEKFQIEVVRVFDFLISSLLSHGFDPNSQARASNKICIDMFVEGLKYVCWPQAVSIYKKMLKDLLRHGSKLPVSKIVENIDKDDNIIEFFNDWPQLMLFYCLDKTNKFTVF